MAGTAKESTRRAFLNWALGTSLLAVLAPLTYILARYLNPPSAAEAVPDEVEAGRTDDPELARKGFKIVRYGQDPVILIRATNGGYRAFSATCTHLGCVVAFRNGPEQKIACNCHGGMYDLSGRNIAGPPPRPLTPYKVRIVHAESRESGLILVSRV